MGFFDDAEVEVNNIPDDPFGFGNDFWPTRIIEVKDPEITKNGQRFGMMIRWAVEHPKFDGHYVSTQGLGYGNWQQLPVPKKLQGQVPWDNNSEEAVKVLFQLKELYKALGIPADQWGKVGKDDLLHKVCLSKIKVQQDENGFWQFRLTAQKPLPSGEGMNEYARATTSNPGGLSPEELVKKELEEDI